jgi:hypothetical protein
MPTMNMILSNKIVKKTVRFRLELNNPTTEEEYSCNSAISPVIDKIIFTCLQIKTFTFKALLYHFPSMLVQIL